MSSTRAASDSEAVTLWTEDWFASWLRTVTLASSGFMTTAAVIGLVSNPSGALVAIPAATLWALIAVGVAYREPAAGGWAGVCGAIFASLVAAASANAFSDGHDNRGWVFAAVFVVAATAAATGVGWWMTCRPRRRPAERGRDGRWPLVAEVACYVAGAPWVVFGAIAFYASVYAVAALALVVLGWFICGFAVGRGMRVPAVVVVLAGATFCVWWLYSIFTRDHDDDLPLWLFVLSALWLLSSATATVASAVVVVRARRGDRTRNQQHVIGELGASRPAVG